MTRDTLDPMSLSGLSSLAFWTAPPSADTDFGAEDPLALDYLAQQVGLWLFPGFTTRTSRAQYYAVVLYGLELADRAIEHFGLPSEDTQRIELFERWERFWSLATVEYRRGLMERSDPDNMRGVRGVRNAWRSGERPLPLEFQLLSRQSELGGLGAYLSSLRRYGLVSPGTLRLGRAEAHEIVAAFWRESGERDSSGAYHDYALSALDPDTKTTPRRRGKLTLRTIGKCSRLSSLVELGRTAQQNRLWNVLFEGTVDATLPLAQQIIAAHREGVTSPEDVLVGLSSSRWGELAPAITKYVTTALAFARAARILLDRFNRVYASVVEAGMVATFDAAANAAFGAKDPDLQRTCEALLSSPTVGRFRDLQYHGPNFVTAVARIISGDTRDRLDALLELHGSVQKSRRGGGPWLRREHDKLILQGPTYNGYMDEALFPGLKIGSVRSLLFDLGRLDETA